MRLHSPIPLLVLTLLCLRPKISEQTMEGKGFFQLGAPLGETSNSKCCVEKEILTLKSMGCYPCVVSCRFFFFLHLFSSFWPSLAAWKLLGLRRQVFVWLAAASAAFRSKEQEAPRGSFSSELCGHMPGSLRSR